MKWCLPITDAYCIVLHCLHTLNCISQYSDFMLIYRQWFVNLSVKIHEDYRVTKKSNESKKEVKKLYMRAVL